MSRARLFLQSLIIGASAFIFHISLIDRAKFFVYQERDLDRALQLISGHLIFFGPEMTGGAHLPGGFYYFLLSLPLAMGLGWHGVMTFMILLNALGVGALWAFFRRFFGFATAVLVAAGYITSRIVVRGLWDFMNSSFVFPFLILALIGICLTFALIEDDRVRKRIWLATCLVMGLGVQIHLTFAFVILSALLLQWGSRRLGLFRIRPRDFYLGLALLIAPLIPYLIWSSAYALGISFGQEPPPYAGGSTHGLSIYLRFLAGNKDFNFVQLSPVGVGPWYHMFQMAIPGRVFGLLTAFMVAIWSVVLVISRRSASRSCTVLAICAAICFVPVLGILQIPLNGRYTNCFGVTLIILVGVLYSGLVNSKRRQRLFDTGAILGVAGFVLLRFPFLNLSSLHVALAGLAVFAVLLWLTETDERPALSTLPWLALLAVFVGLTHHTFLRPFNNSVNLATISEGELISASIFKQTGWSYDTAKSRIFFVNSQYDESLRRIYLSQAQMQPASPAPQSSSNDGFFVTVFNSQQWSEVESDSKQWLSKQSLDPFLLKGIISGGISLGTPQKLNQRIALIPYRAIDREAYPEFFHNRIGGYPETDMDPDPTKDERIVSFNDCPKQESYCRNLFLLKSENLSDPHQALTVRITGVPISLPSIWVSPDWTQALVRPYIRFFCGGGASFAVPLADSIGFRPEGERVWQSNSFLLAPYARQFRPASQTNCTGKISGIQLGYESATVVTQGGRWFSIPGKSESFDVH